MLQEAAGALLVPNAYGALLQSSGAVGLNASTSHDATRYYVSLPSNKLELWFALEAERFQAPTFRSLYPEKEVVAEERRLRLENSPIGALTYEFSQEVRGRGAGIGREQHN
jgi:predicted Zn-dependent peptidase